MIIVKPAFYLGILMYEEEPPRAPRGGSLMVVNPGGAFALIAV